jgi:arylsulfatase A-like enzyme
MTANLKTNCFMPKQPHIIIFNPDQWRGDVLGHMGNPAAQTPHLDEIVKADGVSFRNAFCQNPICTPSRASFMSGWYPHVRGHRTLFHMLRPKEGDPVLLKQLKDHGYFVWWGGKNDLVPAQDGFEDICSLKYNPKDHPPKKPIRRTFGEPTWRGEPGSDTYYSFFAGRLETAGEQCYYDKDWYNIEGAIDAIRNRPEDKPLCIYLPLLYPHPPYAVEDPWFSMIDRSQLPPRIKAPSDWDGWPQMFQGLHEALGMKGWNEQRWNELRATYYGMCARVDHQFGLIVEALRRADIFDDSAIFCFSDHGDFTGDYGLVEKAQNLFPDCLTRVPFIVKPPKSVPVKPRVSDALVELIDFTATAMDWAGVKPAYTHFGRSLTSVIAGETDEHRDAVFCEGGRNPGETHCMESESPEQLKPTGLYYPKVNLQQREDRPYHLKAIMCRTKKAKYIVRTGESDQLFDLTKDPDELHNSIDDPSMKESKLELKDRTLRFLLETADVVPQQPDAREG